MLWEKKILEGIQTNEYLLHMNTHHINMYDTTPPVYLFMFLANAYSVPLFWFDANNYYVVILYLSHKSHNMSLQSYQIDLQSKFKYGKNKLTKWRILDLYK